MSKILNEFYYLPIITSGNSVTDNKFSVFNFVINM